MQIIKQNILKLTKIYQTLKSYPRLLNIDLILFTTYFLYEISMATANMIEMAPFLGGTIFSHNKYANKI